MKRSGPIAFHLIFKVVTMNPAILQDLLYIFSFCETQTRPSHPVVSSKGLKIRFYKNNLNPAAPLSNNPLSFLKLQAVGGGGARVLLRGGG